MFKKLSLTLILPSLLLSDWTLGLSSNSTLKTSQDFIKTFPKELQKDIFIEEINNNFRVNYGVFSSYNDSKKKLLKLSKEYDYLYDMYIRKTKKKIENEIINSNKWTISISTLSTLTNANNFINSQSNSLKNKLYIEKYKNLYRVNFDKFNSYEEAKEIQASLELDDSFVTKTISRNTIKSISPKKVYKSNYSIDNEIRKSKKKLKLPVIKASNKKLEKESYNINQKENNIQTKSYNYLQNQETVNYDRKPVRLIDNEIIKTNQDENYVFVIPNPKIENEESNKKLNNFEIELKISSLKQSGDLKVGNTGSKVDLKEDLNTSNKISLIPKFNYNYNNHRLSFSYENYKSNGNTTLFNDLTLGDYTYLTSDNLKSNLQTSIYDLGYRYNLLDTNIGFNFINYDNKINLNNGSNQTDINLNYNIFALGLNKNFIYDYFLTEVGMKYGIGSNINYFNYNLGFGIKDIYIDNSSLTFGYQNTRLNINDGDIYNGTSNYNSLYLDFKKSF